MVNGKWINYEVKCEQRILLITFLTVFGIYSHANRHGTVKQKKTFQIDSFNTQKSWQMTENEWKCVEPTTAIFIERVNKPRTDVSLLLTMQISFLFVCFGIFFVGGVLLFFGFPLAMFCLQAAWTRTPQHIQMYINNLFRLCHPKWKCS